MFFFVKDLSSKSSVATLNSFGKKRVGCSGSLCCAPNAVCCHMSFFSFEGVLQSLSRYKKSELIPACSVLVSLVSEVHELERSR